MSDLPRRHFLHLAGAFATVAVVPRLLPAARAAPEASSCVDAASESLRASLNYVALAQDPAQSCTGCGFFSADAASAGCGGCQIMSGPVDAAGHCDSWAPKG